MNETLRHDVAVAMTCQLVNMLRSVLNPVEQDLAREQFYTVVLAGLEAYDHHSALLEAPGPTRTEPATSPKWSALAPTSLRRWQR